MSAMKKVFQPLKRVGIIGVPFDKGQEKYGVSLAPQALREAGLLERLRFIEDLEVSDYGDIQIPTLYDFPKEPLVENMNQLALVSQCSRIVSSKVAAIHNDNRIVVTLGGDHSIGVGTIDGHFSVHKDIIVIWVDAHADLNTNRTSVSGSTHGMPVALLAKEMSDYWPYLPTMDWQVPEFSIKNLAYIGLRSVDSYERLAIDKYSIPAFAMEDIEKYGIQAVMEFALNKLDPEQEKPIHVSFDIDSLDALEAPSTGTCVRGGLTLREGISLMEHIHKTGRLRAIDLVEINPALGDEKDKKITLEAGICILQAALGYSRRGILPRHVKDMPLQTYKNHVKGDEQIS